MNKIWNLQSSIMMTKWRKWIVNDKYIIVDNSELEYIYRVWDTWYLNMNRMIINSSTNEDNEYMNIVFKWCDVKYNRLIVEFEWFDWFLICVSICVVFIYFDIPIHWNDWFCCKEWIMCLRWIDDDSIEIYIYWWWRMMCDKKWMDVINNTCESKWIW